MNATYMHTRSWAPPPSQDVVVGGGGGQSEIRRGKIVELELEVCTGWKPAIVVAAIFNLPFSKWSEDMIKEIRGE